MATKALNYTTAEINQRLSLAGIAVQPSALDSYYTKTEVDGKVVVDISTRYSASYANLSAALTALNSDTATDAVAIKKGGVSIKFINSSTNKYEQWSLKASSWSTDTSNWGNTNVTQASEVVYNGQSLSDILPPLDNISKQNAQSEEQAIIYETDAGVQVGKIDPTGADFINLKRGGQQVARMTDLPTKDSSIGENPSTTNVPTTKAVKDYVDNNIPEVPEYPINTESTQSEAEEAIFGNDAGTQQYAKVSSEGIRSVAYKDMQGNDVIPVKDSTIGDTPSHDNVPTSSAVAAYVASHALDVEKEQAQNYGEELFLQNEERTETYISAGEYGLKSKAYLDLNGNPIITPDISHPNRDRFAEEMSAKKCTMQKKVGIYYYPASVEVDDSSHAEVVDYANAKFNRALQLKIKGYTQDKVSTSSADRASMTMKFSAPITCQRTLSFWVNCQHKYIAEPLRYDSQAESLTLDANGKKQQSLHSINIKLYLEEVLKKNITIPISEFQGNVSVLSPSSGDFAGWGYKTPNIKSDIIGWKLLKIPEIVSETFDSVVITLNTYDYYPNMECNLSHVVCDQELMPTLCISKDGYFYAADSLDFTEWCYNHNIPRSGSGALLDDSNLTADQQRANAMVKDMYYNHLIDMAVYNRDQKCYGYKDSIRYLNGDIGNWQSTKNILMSTYHYDRPCITMDASLTYLDEIIVNSAKEVGFKIFRGSGYFNYGGTSYIDTDNPIVYCGNLMNETNANINTEEKYYTALANRIIEGKKAIDDMIAIGECRAMLTHAELDMQGCISESSGAFAEALEEVLTYAKQKEALGLLRITTFECLQKFIN